MLVKILEERKVVEMSLSVRFQREDRFFLPSVGGEVQF